MTERSKPSTSLPGAHLGGQPALPAYAHTPGLGGETRAVARELAHA